MEAAIFNTGAISDSTAKGLCLVFRVRSRLCALPLDHVVETMRPLPIEPFLTPLRFVRGLATVRGAQVPVVDTERLFSPHESEDKTEPGRLITIRSGQHVVALTADGVVGVRRIPDESLQELPPLLKDAEADVISSIATLDKELLLILNSARLAPQELWSQLDLEEARS